MVIGGFDVTDAYIRARQVSPDEFDKKTLRTIRMAPGVKAIVGLKKGEKGTSVQSVLFDKKRFTEDKASSWLKNHSEKFSDAIALEERKTNLFSAGFEEHLEGHLPPLSQAQINRLLDLIGDDEEDEDDGSEYKELSAEFTSKFLKRL
jgi:hypothetical protein